MTLLREQPKAKELNFKQKCFGLMSYSQLFMLIMYQN